MDVVGNNCPADALVPNGTQCRASAGVCNSAESCTGSAAACPADGFLSAATVCRAAGGVCDAAENCTGSGAACPGDNKLPSSTICRAAAGQCDLAENCDGSTNACPANAFKPNGTSCNSGDICAVPDQCTAGTCVAGDGGDSDGDNVCNASDNCPSVSNANQADLDSDGIGDVCDSNDGQLNPTRVKMTTAVPGNDVSKIRLKGDFVILQPITDIFDASNGITFTVSDSKPAPTVRTRSFTTAECKSSGGGTKLSCRTADRTSKARFKVSPRAPGIWAFRGVFKKLALASPLLGPANVVLTYGPSTDRAGSVSDCVTSPVGLNCRQVQ